MPKSDEPPEQPPKAEGEVLEPDWDAIAAAKVAPKEGEVLGAEEKPEDSETIKLGKIRDMFYSVMCGSFTGANMMVSRKIYGGELQSLDLKSYGDVGRSASNSIFDSLTQIEWIRKLLIDNDWLILIAERIAPVIALGVMMKIAVSAELKERAIAAKEEKAANDNKKAEETPEGKKTEGYEVAA